ncbi:MAG: phosphoenolpyruvate synthase, partial [Oscillospiraceae bacterium]|nr:phosphoenolpyruvate synthase [Oscillospiraceae bacterium]
CKIPDILLKEVSNSIEKLGANNFYAIRSSATSEDLPFFSFAGQQDTYLNVKGIDNIICYIVSCFSSIYTDRAILYRLKNNISNENVLMAVVIQKMVFPAVSGIMFTADPVTSSRNIISIDASFGLGEALVSGIVSSDIYKFNKRQNKIESITINEKKLAIIPNEDGGTNKIENSSEKSKSQALSNDDIIKLSKIGISIEEHYGYPQDIEWCIEKDEIYIVQSRNITSLYPIPETKDENPHIYISVNHVQVMTDPISPLGMEIFPNILNPIKEDRYIGESFFIKPAGGWLYLDFNKVLRFKIIGKKFPMFLENVDSLMAKSIEEALKQDELKEIVGYKFISPKFIIKHAIPAMFKIVCSLLFKETKDYNKKMLEAIAEKEKFTLDKINTAKTNLEKLNLICELGSFLDLVEKKMVPYVAPGVLSMILLKNIEKKTLGTFKYTLEVSKGLVGNVTTEMGLQVGDLADLVRKSDVLIKEFENEDYRSLNSRIKELNGFEEFKEKYFSFLERYGSRCSGEIDVAREKWIENPAQIAKIIISTVKTSKEGIHRIEYEKAIKKALESSHEFIEVLKTKTSKINVKIAKRLIKVLRDCLPLREHHKLVMARLFYDFKIILLSLGNEMVSKGFLESANDIFYLRIFEIRDYLIENKTMIEIVEKRKEDYAHYAKLNMPKVMTQDGEEIKYSYDLKNLPKNAIIGTPVSSGVVEGIAKVILDPTKDSLNKGEILIAPFTDPAWTTFFVNAAGLVMEVGGLLTHGTVVAREYGIPAVVNVQNATKIIKTGQKIRLDGNTGIITII